MLIFIGPERESNQHTLLGCAIAICLWRAEEILPGVLGVDWMR